MGNLGLKGKEIRLYGQKILNILSEPVPELSPICRVTSYPNYKKTSDELKLIAQEICSHTGLNQDLLLSRRLINQYVKWQADKNGSQPELLSGWREPLFRPYGL